MPASDQAVEAARQLDTATISDALDKLGIAGVCLGIKPLTHDFRLCGRAYTLRYVGAAQPAGTVGDYIDDVPPYSVVVIDNQGRPNATVWGDILTEVAHRKPLAGTVIDGACRDTALPLELGYPLYSRSYSMRTGKDRVQLESVNEVVTIGEARVAPGDLIRGDADGVLVIPKEHEQAVLDTAQEIHDAEEQIRAECRKGTPLREAREKFRYHQLQSRPTDT